MLVITGIFEDGRFIPDKPVKIPEKKKVTITIDELSGSKSDLTTSERLSNFRKKYNRETFIEHLKKKTEEGHSFDFDVQKLIDGSETDDDVQIRYRLEKQAWGKAIETKA